jgi:hypothetical protein
MDESKKPKKSPKITARPRTDSELNMKWENIAEIARDARAFAELKIYEATVKGRPRSKSSSSHS